jgi:hypothetical protein
MADSDKPVSQDERHDAGNSGSDKPSLEEAMAELYTFDFESVVASFDEADLSADPPAFVEAKGMTAAAARDPATFRNLWASAIGPWSESDGPILATIIGYGSLFKQWTADLTRPTKKKGKKRKTKVTHCLLRTAQSALSV